MPKRILLLDDNPTNLDVIRSTLEPFGYEVIATTELAQALTSVSHTRPDLIVSDLYMPDSSGIEFVTKIKRDPQLKSIPFIMITSQTWNKADRESGLALGADKFLYRPIEPQKLLDEIRELLPDTEPRSQTGKPD